MFKNLTLSFFISAVLSPSIFAITVVPKTIYVEDNRNEVYSSPTVIQELSSSIAAHVSKEYLTEEKNGYKITASTLGKAHCPTVRFSDQVTGARCSGFLVAPNVVATAGHCMISQNECENYRWIFDYKLKGASDKSYQLASKSNVYSCKKILAQKLEYIGGIDYALVQLDRNVENRNPVAVDFDNDTIIGTPLYVLGFPSGIPMKYTDTSSIFENSPKTFKSLLDIFAGNSGSAVFSAETNKVIGIVSMGTGDWTWNQANTCKVEKICREGEKCEPNVMSKMNYIKKEFEQALQAAKVD